MDQKTCFQDGTRIHETKQSKEKQLQEKFDNIIKKEEKKEEKKQEPPQEQNETVIKMQVTYM